MASKETSDTATKAVNYQTAPPPDLELWNIHQSLHNLLSIHERVRSEPSDLTNDPPRYIENEASLPVTVRQLAEAAQVNGLDLPIREYPEMSNAVMRGPREYSATIVLRQAIVQALFNAIETKKDEIIALFLDNNLVATETIGLRGQTPLLAAVDAEYTRTVQQLMDYDADINVYGVAGLMRRNQYFKTHLGSDLVKIYRTPLQLAAEKGNLVLVKLLMETYHADDSLIAPDGELALRLAAANGHKEVVDYLPSRRGGGWRRWRVKHSKAMDRAKRAGRHIAEFFYILLYRIPRFFIWSVPKHLVVLPIGKGITWMCQYEYWKELPEKIKQWLKEKLLKRIKRIVKGIADPIKNLPRIMRKLMKRIWQMIRATPQAINIAALCIRNGFRTIGTAMSLLFERLFSLLHTMVTAIATFFRELTLKDAWNGVRALLRVIFVDGPKAVWNWATKFGEITYKIARMLFGFTGEVLWWITRGLVEVIVFVPKKLWEILSSCGHSAASGGKEILIWINPKRL